MTWHVNTPTLERIRAYVTTGYDGVPIESVTSQASGGISHLVASHIWWHLASGVTSKISRNQISNSDLVVRIFRISGDSKFEPKLNKHNSSIYMYRYCTYKDSIVIYSIISKTILSYWWCGLCYSSEITRWLVISSIQLSILWVVLDNGWPLDLWTKQKCYSLWSKQFIYI